MLNFQFSLCFRKSLQRLSLLPFRYQRLPSAYKSPSDYYSATPLSSLFEISSETLKIIKTDINSVIIHEFNASVICTFKGNF